MGWKIIRPQHGKDAMRLVPDSGADSKRALQPPLRGEFGIGRNRNIDLGDHAFDFGMALTQRLARLPRDEIERESVVSGKSVSLRVDIGVRRTIKNKKPTE